MQFIARVVITSRIQLSADTKEEAIELLETQTFVACDCGEVVYEDVEVWSCEEVEDE